MKRQSDFFIACKKALYIALTVVLAFLLTIILHVGLEVIFYNYLIAAKLPVLTYYTPIYGHSLLPFSVQLTLFNFGVISGFLLGFFWWRIVYIEHKHWSNRKQK